MSVSGDNFVAAIKRGAHLDEKEILDEALSWLSILWKRGFFHHNPLGPIALFINLLTTIICMHLRCQVIVNLFHLVTFVFSLNFSFMFLQLDA